MNIYMGKPIICAEILHIHVQAHSTSGLDGQGLTIKKHDLVEGVAEIKVESINAAAENECFYNMFIEGVKITVKSLVAGKVIKKVTIFGIVVAAHQPSFAHLLKLIIDYEERACTFYKSATTAEFSLLLNEVISILDRL